MKAAFGLPTPLTPGFDEVGLRLEFAGSRANEVIYRLV